MRRGVELDDIAEITKVSPTNLRYIEEERFKNLPAEVYVRGFVTAYARTIGLDPERVVPTYMERFRDAQGAKRKGFLLGGK
jgi:cytoskeletal protein RodZ